MEVATVYFRSSKSLYGLCRIRVTNPRLPDMCKFCYKAMVIFFQIFPRENKLTMNGNSDPRRPERIVRYQSPQVGTWIVERDPLVSNPKELPFKRFIQFPIVQAGEHLLREIYARRAYYSVNNRVFNLLTLPGHPGKRTSPES